MTFASTLGKILPTSMFKLVKPQWDLFSQYRRLSALGGSVERNRRLGCWVARRPMANGRPMAVCVHSYKEIRRVSDFGEYGETDVVWRWLHWIKDCRMLYDVGASNGMEGLLANHLHSCSVAFIEPYSPSVITILKSIWLSSETRQGGQLEVVHAGCDEQESYSRLQMHSPPIPGQNLNTFRDKDGYEDPTGRSRVDVVATQWVKGITLDSLAYIYDLAPPSHVKIDVDGFETRVMRGAKRLLKEKVVDSWVIEINGHDRIAEIHETMRDAGYVEVGSFEHYPGYVPPTIDYVYVKPELVKSWSNFVMPPEAARNRAPKETAPLPGVR